MARAGVAHWPRNPFRHDRYKELRLSGLLAMLDVRLQEAAGHHLTYAEFLKLALHHILWVN